MLSDLLTRPDRSGVYTLPPELQGVLTAAATSAGIALLTVDLFRCRTAASVLTKIGQALKFPDWYGANFDALNDCLGDPEWNPAPTLIVRFDGLKTLHDAHPESLATLVEVLQAVADERRSAGCAFWLLLDTPARGVAILPRA